MNPYAVLNLPQNCTDADVRNAYQNLLRIYPPEKHPNEFSKIAEAAKLLKTKPDRCRWILTSLSKDDSPEETLEDFASYPNRKGSPGMKNFRSILQICNSAVKNL